MRGTLERERLEREEQRERRPDEAPAPDLLLAQNVGNQRFGELLGRGQGPAPGVRVPAAEPADTAVGRALAETVSTRNPAGVKDDEFSTVDPEPTGGGPATATPAANGNVSSGPTYTPSGTVPVVSAGGRKRASFRFNASFLTDATKGTVPRCCEIRQYIKWDKAFADYRGGPPHSGFPSGTAHDTWIEDRDAADKRYGHRAGTHSDPIAGGDEYCTAGVRDQANGDTYIGSDSPGGPDSIVGQYQFQLKAIDTCNGNAVKASSSVITINW